MPRKATGTLVKAKNGLWQAVVTLADGSRKRLPPFPAGISEQMAREKAAHYAERVRELGLESGTPRQPKPDAKVSCEAWIATWHAARVAKGFSSARVGLGHWTEHLRPILGSKHPKDWTRDDFRSVSKALDDKVVAKQFSWKTASNVWATAIRLADDAGASKDDALRCRNDNPAAGVRGPDRGEKVIKQYLYPSEFLQLMACEAVPLEWRRIFAIGVYTYARLGELLALTWDDVDLLHGTISITKSIDSNDNARTATTIKTTKSKSPRSVAIEPGLLPLLVAMRAECQGKGRVVEFPRARRHADSLREMLELAGIKRAALYNRAPSVKPIRFHDLRSTGITWMAVRGDDPLRMQQRAGHSSFTTTQIYIREADVLRDGFGEVFPKLPESLLGLNRSPSDRLASPETAKASVLAPAFPSSLWAQQGLNLRLRPCEERTLPLSYAPERRLLNGPMAGPRASGLYLESSQTANPKLQDRGDPWKKCMVRSWQMIGSFDTNALDVQTWSDSR